MRLLEGSDLCGEGKSAGINGGRKICNGERFANGKPACASGYFQATVQLSAFEAVKT